MCQTRPELWIAPSKPFCLVYYYNGAQRYEQFLQVSQLYRALILLSLALLSSEHLCVFGLHGAIYVLKKFFAYILFIYLLVS